MITELLNAEISFRQRLKKNDETLTQTILAYYQNTLNFILQELLSSYEEANQIKAIDTITSSIQATCAHFGRHNSIQKVTQGIIEKLYLIASENNDNIQIVNNFSRIIWTLETLLLPHERYLIRIMLYQQKTAEIKAIFYTNPHKFVELQELAIHTIRSNLTTKQWDILNEIFNYKKNTNCKDYF